MSGDGDPDASSNQGPHVNTFSSSGRSKALAIDATSEGKTAHSRPEPHRFALLGSLTALICVCASPLSHAQDIPTVAPPRIEFGANVGRLMAGGYGTSHGSSMDAIYFAQVKQTLRAGSQNTPSIFATYGGQGLFSRSRTNAQHFTSPTGGYDYPARSQNYYLPPFATFLLSFFDEVRRRIP